MLITHKEYNKSQSSDKSFKLIRSSSYFMYIIIFESDAIDMQHLLDIINSITSTQH